MHTYIYIYSAVTYLLTYLLKNCTTIAKVMTSWLIKTLYLTKSAHTKCDSTVLKWQWIKICSDKNQQKKSAHFDNGNVATLGLTSLRNFEHRKI